MSDKEQFLFVGGPWHGNMREVEEVRGFVAEIVAPSGFEEQIDGQNTYTKRGVYLDFDDARCVRQVFVYDGEELRMERVFDAVLRAFFAAGKRLTLPPADPFAAIFGSKRTPFDGMPGGRGAN